MLFLQDLEFLESNGVRITLPGHLTLPAAVKAMYEHLKSIRDGVSPIDLRDTVASPDLMARIIGKADHNQWIQEFLT